MTQNHPQSEPADGHALIESLRVELHHNLRGLHRVADSLQALVREGAHDGTGKTFAAWATTEFSLPPALTAALLHFRLDQEPHGGQGS